MSVVRYAIVDTGQQYSVNEQQRDTPDVWRVLALAPQTLASFTVEFVAL